MGLVLGADVGGTHLRLGLFDAEGWQLLWQGKRSWRGADDSPESLAAALMASLREAELATGRVLMELPLGMGLAIWAGAMLPSPIGWRLRWSGRLGRSRSATIFRRL